MKIWVRYNTGYLIRKI